MESATTVWSFELEGRPGPEDDNEFALQLDHCTTCKSLAPFSQQVILFVMFPEQVILNECQCLEHCKPGTDSGLRSSISRGENLLIAD